MLQHMAGTSSLKRSPLSRPSFSEEPCGWDQTLCLKLTSVQRRLRSARTALACVNMRLRDSEKAESHLPNTISIEDLRCHEPHGDGVLILERRVSCWAVGSSACLSLAKIAIPMVQTFDSGCPTNRVIGEVETSGLSEMLMNMN